MHAKYWIGSLASAIVLASSGVGYTTTATPEGPNRSGSLTSGRLETAKIFFELNATARDAGIQMLLDGEGWDRARVVAPDGRSEVLDVRASGSVGKIGVTELFFESAEPTLADLPLSELLKMFPAGDYQVAATSVEGISLVGTAKLSHRIPARPHVVTPREGGEVDRRNLVVDWRPVIRPEGIKIFGYQVIVEREEPLRVFSADLPARQTSVTVPREFLRADKDYKLEVIAVARNGNQTITEVEFSTQ